MKYSILELSACAVQAFVENGQVCVRLEDGRELRFPAAKNRRLRNATPEQLGNIEIICNGTGLHWPDLDEDLSVDSLIAGRPSGENPLSLKSWLETRKASTKRARNQAGPRSYTAKPPAQKTRVGGARESGGDAFAGLTILATRWSD